MKPEDVYDILILANECEIISLKDICSEYIKKHLNLENVCQSLEIAVENSCQKLVDACLRFIDSNIVEILEEQIGVCIKKFLLIFSLFWNYPKIVFS